MQNFQLIQKLSANTKIVSQYKNCQLLNKSSTNAKFSANTTIVSKYKNCQLIQKLSANTKILS
jgi:hypothetical protein